MCDVLFVNGVGNLCICIDLLMRKLYASYHDAVAGVMLLLSCTRTVPYML